MISNHHDLPISNTSIIDDRPILVSQKKIKKRRCINASTLASFVVDNIPINPDNQHIFKDFEEHRIATIKDMEAYYTLIILK